MFRIVSLEKLVHEMSRLPGIGPKTAARLAYFILRSPDLNGRLRSALHQVQESTHECPRCFSYTDSADLCHYCSDSARRSDICVVEEPLDIVKLESSGAFRGQYHVLHGTIAPLDNVGPQDLRIRELLARLELKDETGLPIISEVILALDPDLEGDTTVLYLTKILSELKIRVTRIASGVPIGSDIEYVDDRTLGRALENRITL
jgi:recombination protein RecR